jgi:hypothetical protein
MIKLLVFIFATFFLFLSKSHALDTRITDLVDLDGGAWAGESGNINIEDDICVYSDSGIYTITASGNGAANRFRVANGSEFMNYTVRWNDVVGTTSGQLKLTKDVASVNQTTSETISDDCSGGSSLTAHIQVRLGNGQLRQNLPGTYAGTLTLLITAI